MAKEFVNFTEDQNALIQAAVDYETTFCDKAKNPSNTIKKFQENLANLIKERIVDLPAVTLFTHDSPQGILLKAIEKSGVKGNFPKEDLVTVNLNTGLTTRASSEQEPEILHSTSDKAAQDFAARVKENRRTTEVG